MHDTTVYRDAQVETIAAEVQRGGSDANALISSLQQLLGISWTNVAGRVITHLERSGWELTPAALCWIKEMKTAGVNAVTPKSARRPKAS